MAFVTGAVVTGTLRAPAGAAAFVAGADVTGTLWAPAGTVAFVAGAGVMEIQGTRGVPNSLRS